MSELYSSEYRAEHPRQDPVPTPYAAEYEVEGTSLGAVVAVCLRE